MLFSADIAGLDGTAGGGLMPRVGAEGRLGAPVGRRGGTRGGVAASTRQTLGSVCSNSATRSDPARLGWN